MKKYETLKKRLFKELIILGTTVVVFGGIAFYVFDYVESQENRKRAAESSIQQMDSQARSIQANYEKANVSINLYQEITDRLSEGSLSTSDEVLRDTLVALKEKYRLSQLNLKLEPPNAYNVDAAVQNNTVVDVSYNKVELKLGGMSDLHLYSFLVDLKQTLSGLVKISSFTISRERQLTDDTLFRISKGAIPQAVVAELSFYWLGIEEKV